MCRYKVRKAEEKVNCSSSSVLLLPCLLLLWFNSIILFLLILVLFLFFLLSHSSFNLHKILAFLSFTRLLGIPSHHSKAIIECRCLLFFTSVASHVCAQGYFFTKGAPTISQPSLKFRLFWNLKDAGESGLRIAKVCYVDQSQLLTGFKSQTK